MGRDGADRHAEADRRADPQVVRPGGRPGRHQEVPRAVRRGRAGADAGRRPGEMMKDVKDWGENVKLAKIEPQG